MKKAVILVVSIFLLCSNAFAKQKVIQCYEGYNSGRDEKNCMEKCQADFCTASSLVSEGYEIVHISPTTKTYREFVWLGGHKVNANSGFYHAVCKKAPETCKMEGGELYHWVVPPTKSFGCECIGKEYIVNVPENH